MPILNRLFYMLFRWLKKFKLKYRIISELSLSYYVKLSLFLSKYCKNSHVFSDLLCICFEFTEVFEYDIRIFLKINEHILMFLDSFKLPIRTIKNEVKIQLSVGSKLNFNIFTNPMQLLHEYLHSE